MVSVILALAASAVARPITEREASAVAQDFVRAMWGESRPLAVELYHDVAGQPAVYLCERLLPDGSSGTVMVGARTDMPPVLLFHSGPGPAQAAAEAELIAARALDTDCVRKAGSVYYSPFDLWYEYTSGSSQVMVSLRSLQACEPGLVRSVEPFACPGPSRLRFEEEWSERLSGEPPALLDGFHWIEDVPDWDWHYGCGPTAAANVLTYWDRRGYDRLVDTVWVGVPDRFEGDLDSVPNVSQELAVAMRTDTLGSGSTLSDDIPAGITAVCNDPAWQNQAEFRSWLDWNDQHLLVTEIDQSRPGVLSLAGHPEYGTHAVTFCGWGPPDTDWVLVRDGWGSTPVDKVVYIHYGAPFGVIPVKPTREPAPDVSIISFERPHERVEPGSVQPEVRIRNSGFAAGEPRISVRIERADSGLDQNFDSTSAFPPEGWQRYNIDAGPRCWERDTAPPEATPGGVTCRRETSTRVNDDWLVTPKVRVNTADSLHFVLGALGESAESIEVWISLTGSAPADFDHLARAVRVGSRTSEPAWIGFRPVGDTWIYVGFRYVMPEGTPGAGVRLDHVRLTSVYYQAKQEVLLDPGQEQTLRLPAWSALPGRYAARCSLYCPGDSNPFDSLIVRPIQVRQPIGPAPLPSTARATGLQVYPTPARQFVGCRDWQGPARACVVDAAGRVVFRAHVETARRIALPVLPAGAYLLRLERPSAGSASGRFVVAR